MKKNLWVVLLSLCAIVAGCDLQPKIASVPDGVGDFISERYPTLLAEPDSEIYQSAVADYGVYASPTLYGNSNGEDYVLYSATGDYIMPEQPVADTTDTTDTVDVHDTGDVDDDVAEPDTPTDDVLVVGDRATQDTADTTDEEKPTAEEYGFTPDDDVQDLKIPDYVTPKKAEEKPAPVAKQEVKDTKPAEVKKAETKKAEPKAEQKTAAPAKAEPAKSNEIIVAKGDTLYSLARKHSLTVDELATANKLKSPYALSVGQKLKLPVADKKPDAVARVADKKVEPKPVAKAETKTAPAKAETKPAPKVEPKPEAKPVAKPVAKKPETKKPEVKKTEPAKQTAVVRVPLREVTVAKGDTLYSISRKYSVAVNDLATINKLSAPFALSVGQKIKVPDLAGAQKKTDAKPVAETKKTAAPAQKKDAKKADVKPAHKAATKPAVKGDAKKTTAKTPAKKTETKKAEPKKTAAKQTAQKKQETPKTNKKAQPMVARSSSKFSWPVRGKILSGYGAKSNGLFNDGINIKAARGTTVVAAENGFVAYAGNEVKGMGNLVIIQHADGWMTVYAHMDSMTVRRGHKVTVGQKIGTVGTAGKVDQAQLHFEIRKGTKAYNPVNYLKK